MSSFIGEFECSVDAKGRVLFPAALKRQVSPEAGDKFVLNRGFEKCLNLYPYNVWKEITAEMEYAMGEKPALLAQEIAELALLLLVEEEAEAVEAVNPA